MASTPTESGSAPTAPELIGQRLTAYVQQSGQTLGARLGLLARALFPSFHPAQYGCRNLRTFIEKYAPDLRVVAKSGPDPIYGTGSAEGPTQTEAPAESGADLWRVWVSPGAAFAIRVDPETGSVAIAQKDEPVTAGHIFLPPASLDTHRARARGFLDGVEDGLLRAELTGYLDSEGQWWRAWFLALRRDSAQLARWQDYRQRMLTEALRQALSESGLKADIVTTALNGIVSSRRKRPVPGPRYFEPLAAPLAGDGPAGGELRQIVQLIAARMSERELRNISVPLGLTLDAIEHIKASR